MRIKYTSLHEMQAASQPATTLINLEFRGIIKKFNGRYEGQAADGTWVHLGEDSPAGREQLVAYLQTHATPASW